MNDDSKELYKRISEKIEQETKASGWSIFNNIISGLGALAIAVIGYFTYSHNRQLSNIDSVFNASKLIGDLVNSLTEDSLKRDIAVLAVSHSLTSDHKNSDINNIHLAYEITERIAYKTINEHKQKVEKYNSSNSTNRNNSDDKLFDLTNYQINLINDLTIVLDKNRKIGKTLDTYNGDSNLFTKEEDFAKRSQLLANRSAEIYAEFIILSDYNYSLNQEDLDSLRIKKIQEKKGLNRNQINRMNLASREIISNAANNKNTIFTIFDNRIFYYKDNNRKLTTFDIEKHLKESLFATESSVDNSNWYISETYKSVKIKDTGCVSSIRYFHNSDKDTAEELKEKLQSTENKFGRLVENTFETLDLTEWTKTNGIDVNQGQLEVWLMSRQKCQVKPRPH